MMLGWRARIGQIRPSTGIEGAEEWRAVTPAGVAYVETRYFLPRIDDEGLRVMMSNVVECARQLATAKVDIIAQCGAPGTFLRGAEFDKTVISEIEEATGVKAITMSGAQMAGLKALGARKIAVGTIYSDEVNATMTKYLEANGFEVKHMQGLQIVDPFAASTHDIDSSYKLGREVHKKAGKVDAILLSCGTYRTFGMLQYLELDTGVPVVSSNQATLWQAMRELGLRDMMPNLGKLFTII